MKTFEISHVPIKGKEMVRELNSKAVLNTDIEALKAYRDRMLAMEQMSSYGQDINILKNEMSDIKKILLQLIKNQEA